MTYMKRALLTTLLSLVLFAPLTAQTQACDQAFIDSANRAFRDVVAQRDVIAAQTAEIQARKDKEAAQDALIKALTESNDVLKADNKSLRAMTCSTTSFMVILIRVRRCK